MAIKDKDKKMLWTQAANRCAFCKQKLVIKYDGTATLVGEQCHIVSEKGNGPRHRDLEDYDSYDNLIILCANHHKLIDDNPNTFTEDILKTIKSNHENNVNLIEEHNDYLLLSKLGHTRELVRCLYEIDQVANEYPLEAKDDYELFAEFFEYVNNMDILCDYDEFYRISHLEPIVQKVWDCGYEILLTRKESFGSAKLSTAFVYIVTKEYCEETKISL